MQVHRVPVTVQQVVRVADQHRRKVAGRLIARTGLIPGANRRVALRGGATVVRQQVGLDPLRLDIGQRRARTHLPAVWPQVRVVVPGPLRDEPRDQSLLSHHISSE